jgi:hypothetical protein
MNTVFVSLDLIHTSINDRPFDQIECIRCKSFLHIHQPDEELADRLLGTCPDCFAWYLIDAAEGLMVLLPDQTDLRNA